MTSNLALPLSAGTAITASKNDGSTFEWVPTSCGTGGACAMNNHTVYVASRGWFYSWYAATAGTGKSSDAGITIDGSICPAGWKLPITFATIISKYGIAAGGSGNSIAKLEGVPMSFARKGRYVSGRLADTSEGYYWTSHANNALYAASLVYHSVGTYPNYSEDKPYGFPVRCIAI